MDSMDKSEAPTTSACSGLVEDASDPARVPAPAAVDSRDTLRAALSADPSVGYRRDSSTWRATASILGGGARPFAQIPGPRALPLVGNAWRFLPLVGQYAVERLDEVMVSLGRHGRLARFSGLVGHPDLVFLFDARLVAHVLRREDACPHRPAMPSIQHYKARMRKHFFGETPGLIGVHGEPWEHFRAQVQQPLLEAGAARRYVPALQQVADDFLHRVHEVRDENQELPADFIDELYTWALESVARVALDRRLGCLSADAASREEPRAILAAIKDFFPLVAHVELRLPLWRLVATPAFNRYIAALDTFTRVCLKYINEAIERIRDTPGSEDRADGEKSIIEKILEKTSDPKVAAILALDMLLVGVDTTSVAAASTLYQLSRNPEKQAALLRELRRALPTPRSPLSAAHLEGLPYLKACIKETLRMYPVIIGNGRCLQSDAVIEDFHIPKGTHVIFPHLCLGRSERYFPQPAAFLPERWTAAWPGGRLPDHQHASLPFGHGRRMCVGRRFAEAELQILIAKIVRRYQVEYHYGEIKYKVHPTYVPESPLKFRLVSRPN
ncbi:probable cytochrome P450 49a1 [Schistocerca piceifrons]|uniref:probable cytochrome P450 49a1 n=1 Tax=Schistocerca piceifrons TaxID=274613 RepID=UPI001F5F1FB7|nr:probable cytochrome P450 49a1 [Schistocerca piceifrons]